MPVPLPKQVDENVGKKLVVSPGVLGPSVLMVLMVLTPLLRFGSHQRWELCPGVDLYCVIFASCDYTS